jgi:hypothetical protein
LNCDIREREKVVGGRKYIVSKRRKRRKERQREQETGTEKL